MTDGLEGKDISINKDICPVHPIDSVEQVPLIVQPIKSKYSEASVGTR